MFFKEMETERLLLKNISRDDREFILSQFSDYKVTRYLYDAEPLSNIKEADELIDFYLQLEPRMHHRWILNLKSNGQRIGTCGFHCWNKNNYCVDVGYDLKEDYWGQGYMTEAMRAIISFAEKNMDVYRIDAHIYVQNLKSIALVRKFNFEFIGKTETCIFRDKEYLHHIYSLNIPIDSKYNL